MGALNTAIIIEYIKFCIIRLDFILKLSEISKLKVWSKHVLHFT